MEEPMSLATFEPDRAFAPYLNTPRSLEACRLHGINPVELVEIPISEFHKDFPNDPDAAQRRFERIDGARRRYLADVTKDWKILCAQNWQPQTTRPKTAQEAILEVRPEAHSTLLELQAKRFRKMEEDNFNAFNRILKMEVKKADEEVKNKKILEKHNDIQASNDQLKKERQDMREALLKEGRERAAKKEADRMAEIRALQELDAKYAHQQKLQEIENKKAEKAFILKREEDRVAREEYTRQMKDSIFHNVENKINNKKKVVELRDKLLEDRLTQFKNEKARIAEEKRLAMEAKLTKAREEIARNDENERLATLRKIEENEAYRKQIQDMKDANRKEEGASNDNATKEKMNSILTAKENIVKEKQNKTLMELQLKETLAQQELNKVKEAQDKRKCIKSIKQEAYEIAAARTRKAQEYKMMKLQQDLKDKEDRCNAIKKGFTVLSQMRNSMKDIMTKTTVELKAEMHHLRHINEFSPDTVVNKAMEVSYNVLFPRLERTFGILDPNAPTNSSTLAKSSDLFGFDFENKDKHKNRGGDAKAGFLSTTTQLDHAMQQSHKKGPHVSKSLDASAQSRTNFATLHIQSLTHDRLAAALKESRERYNEPENGATTNVYGQRVDTRAGSASPSPHRRNKLDKSILKLAPEDYMDDNDDEGEEYGDKSRPGSRGGNKNHHKNHPRAASSPSLSRKQQKNKQLNAHSPHKLQPLSHTTPNMHNNISSHNSSNNSLNNSFNMGNLNSLTQNNSQRDNNSRSGNYNPNISTENDGSISLKHNINPDNDDLSSNASILFNQNSFNNMINSGNFNNSAEGNYTPADSARKNHNNGVAFSPDSQHKSPNNKSPHTNNSHGMNSGEKRNKSTVGKKYHTHNYEKDKPVLRTDVNEKAKFLEPPPGKFRREFSLDHPLAENGTGKYNKELKKGILPTGLEMETKQDANVASILSTANKIERLTYTASAKVVDPEMQLERIKKEQNDLLKQVINEERHAEEQRESMGRMVYDPEEKDRLDSIFAEERRRASERIIKATKEHEFAIKQAVLSMMNLGVHLKVR